MKLTYTKVGDYLFPNLTIKNQKYKRINKYGLLKLHYLKKNSKALYTTLLIIAEEIILNELIYNKNVWVQTIIFVLASTEFVLPYKFYYGKFPYPYFERIKLLWEKEILKLMYF